MGPARGSALRRFRLSSRLALITAACACGAVTAFAILAYLQISRSQFGQIDGAIRDRVNAIERELDSNSELDVSAPIRSGNDAPSADRELIAQVFYQRSVGARQPFVEQRGLGKLTSDTTQFSPLPDTTVEDRPVDIKYYGDKPYRMIKVTNLPALSDGRGQVMRVARFSGNAETAVSQARFRLTIGAILLSVVAVLVALFSARRGLKPLRQVQEAAEYVAENEDLGVRLSRAGPREISGLAGSMNAMLERLETSQQRLETALEEQRRFAQDASHELRTPLTAIRGHIDLLQRYEIPAEDRTAIVGEMGDAADRMRRLVEGLLALARTEGRGGQPEVLSLTKILHEVATADGEEPVIDDDDDEMLVSGDPEQVRGIFGNLVENGRRYGGGNVHVAARREDGFAVVEVTDEGPGIPAEDRERVFDRFYRAPGLRSTPGSGLGLAIARQATVRIGGSLQLLDSDRGARFEVRLPLVTDEVDETELPPGVLPVGEFDEEDE